MVTNRALANAEIYRKFRRPAVIPFNTRITVLVNTNRK